MKKYNRTTLQFLTAGTTLCALAVAAHGADKPAAGLFTKPAWLTDLSLGIKEGYDSNLLLVSGDGTMSEACSWVTTISPKIGVNFAPLLGDQKLIQSLSLGYAPDFVIYHSDSADPAGSKESYNAHRFTGALKAKSGALSLSMENSLYYIDGDENGAVYHYPDDSNRSAYATAVARERRKQIQDRAKIVINYDLGKWFLRPTATFLDYDFLTNQKNLNGYQNYADRYDVNGGMDLGYKVKPELAVTVGYRYGHQSQEQYSFDATGTSSPSDYQRVLLGVEGKPWKWLTVNLQAGPDFRTYPDNTPGHTSPINDKSPTTYYGEASVTADVTAKDQVAFKYKQWQWVSSTGKIPYFDSTYDLTYKRTVTKKLSVELGARLLASDYTSGNVAASQRQDWQYTFAVSASYKVNANLGITAGYSYDLGRNEQDGVVNPQLREFDRSIFALGATYKF